MANHSNDAGNIPLNRFEEPYCVESTHQLMGASQDAVSTSEERRKLIRPNDSQNVLDAQLATSMSATGPPNGPTHQPVASKIQSTRRPSYELFKTPNLTSHPARKWRSFWLTAPGFILTISIIVSITVGLIVIFSLSQDQHGLRAPYTRHSYIWKYAPTAVLVCFGWIWQRTDYMCRILSPWMDLSQAPTPCERNLLADYLSPFISTSIFRAYQHKHWAVLASMIGSLLVVLASATSTGLLVLTPVTFSENRKIITNETFGLPNYNQTYPDLAFVTYYAILNDGLPQPYGTVSDKAYSKISIEPQMIADNATITTTIPVFVPDYQCQFPTSLKHNASDWIVINEATVVTADVEDNGCSLFDTFEIPLADYIGSNFSSRLLLGLDQSLGFYCYSGPYKDNYIYMDAYGIADTAFEIDSGGNTLGKIQAMSLVLCSPDYSIELATISVDTSKLQTGPAIDIMSTTSGSKLQIANFSSMNFGDVFESAKTLISTVSVFENSSSVLDTGTFNQWVPAISPMFTLMTSLNGHSTFEPFLNNMTLQNITENVFRGLGAQMGNSLLATSHNTSYNATVEYFQERLIVHLFPFCVMLTSFIGLLACHILTFWFNP